MGAGREWADTTFLIILRGPAGAGKTTLARALQSKVDDGLAVVDTDMFSWQTVPGEPDKALVYRNVTTVARNYLQCRRSVIVAGLIITSEEAGAIDQLRRDAQADGVTFLDFYCWAPRSTVVERNQARRKNVPEEWVARWWHEAETDKRNVAWPLIELDMRRELPSLVHHVLDTVTAAQSPADAPG
ncbi:AAA family ATPase [Nonomuraea diastatica]|uniref:AAA family ATPase n=1 Tax=Nonomuraea diastatica TaxID=1848329 RepID=UPI001408D53C|nr:AAA family ATPase [Nonomuraea diastatica]